MSLQLLSDDNPLWKEIIKPIQVDIFYQPEYSRFMRQTGPHDCRMFFFQDELGSVFDVYRLKSVETLPFFDLVRSRFASPPIDLTSLGYNGPVIQSVDQNRDELFRRYREAIDEYGRGAQVATEFVRIHPLTKVEPKTLTLSVALSPGSDQVDVDLRQGHGLISKGYRKGHKSAIKKGARESASMRFLPPDTENISRFSTMYHQSMSRLNAKSVYFYSKDYFHALFFNLPSHSLLMESACAGRTVAYAILLYSDKILWYWLLAMDPEMRQTGAHAFAMDALIQWACEQNFEHLILGGYEAVGDSMYINKRGYSKRTLPVNHIKKVHDPDTVELLLNAKRDFDLRNGQTTRLDYFPSYWLA